MAEKVLAGLQSLCRLMCIHFVQIGHYRQLLLAFAGFSSQPIQASRCMISVGSSLHIALRIFKLALLQLLVCQV